MNKLFLKIENKKIIQLDCPICKKLFYIENWRLKNTKSPCCSKKCSVILKQSFRIKCNCDFCNDINLITLCNACNIKANYNRNNWEVLYNNKINEIYGVCNEKI